MKTKLKTSSYWKMLIVLLIISSACSVNKENADNNNDWRKDNLIGKVKSFTETSYKVKKAFGKIEKGQRERKDGFLSYNDFQNVYDKNGNIIELNFYEEGRIYKLNYRYNDEKEEKIGYDFYNADGSLYHKIVFKYDDKGNVIEEKVYDTNDSLNYKSLYKYDIYGNRIEENDYDASGTLNNKVVYKYDVTGNKVEQNGYNADGDLVNKITFKYDDKGNIIDENGYNADGSLNYKWTYKYEYDDQGNWIKRIEFKYNNAEYVVERKYEYYK